MYTRSCELVITMKVWVLLNTLSFNFTSINILCDRNIDFTDSSWLDTHQSVA